MPKRVKNLVGLDIDSASISVAEVRVNGRLTIDNAAVAALEEGIVRDGEIVDPDGLSAALRDLYRGHKGLGKAVRVGVANQKIVVRVFDLPPTTSDAELDAAVRFRAQDELPMPLDQAVIDYQSIGTLPGENAPAAQPGQRVLLVAARRDMIDRMLGAVEGAGLRPAGIDLSAFAMVRALHRPSPEDELVLYLAVGGLTNLALAHGPSCLFTRTSGSGLEGLSVHLAERQRLTLEHARGWLVHVGVTQPLEQIEGDPEIVGAARQVLLEGARRIAADVRNSLDYFSMQGTVAAPTRGVLTGPAAAVPGFEKALSSELSLPVELGVVDGAPDGLEPGRVTVAAGLAITEARA